MGMPGGRRRPVVLASLLLPALSVGKKGADNLALSGYVHARWSYDGRTGVCLRQGFGPRRARLEF